MRLFGLDLGGQHSPEEEAARAEADRRRAAVAPTTGRPRCGGSNAISRR